jgi:hypothetical protein
VWGTRSRMLAHLIFTLKILQNSFMKFLVIVSLMRLKCKSWCLLLLFIYLLFFIIWSKSIHVAVIFLNAWEKYVWRINLKCNQWNYPYYYNWKLRSTEFCTKQRPDKLDANTIPIYWKSIWRPQNFWQLNDISSNEIDTIPFPNSGYGLLLAVVR